MALTTIRVACASDANYAMPLGVMLTSLSVHLPADTDAEIFVLDDGIPAVAKERTEQAAGARIRIHWIPAGELPSGLVTWGRITLTTYHKVKITDWVPRHVDRILWLDADLMIRADLTPLWSMPLNDDLALAAIDERLPHVSSKGAVGAWRELQLDADEPHFNAGVMAIDLDAWRREDVAAQSFDYLQRYADRVYYWDQEALNAVLARRWRTIDPRWNQHPGLPGAPPSADALILHFSGNLKPWNYVCEEPAWVEYYAHLDRTPWAGWRPQRTWRGALTARYQSSRLRRFLYPAESWAIAAVRSATAKYSRNKSDV